MAINPRNVEVFDAQDINPGFWREVREDELQSNFLYSTRLFAEGRTFLGVCEEELTACKGGSWYIEWIEELDLRLNQAFVVLPSDWSFPATVASDVIEVSTLRFFAQRAKGL
ncbi:hypothetical protein WJX84_000112 [Apatococcus fuscideae]|uniref:Uncharacterized protein n=1 Tax=Apatococcus fuscideae TaxID=2026836 RepID=A0AAW1RUN8_9CHLO